MSEATAIGGQLMGYRSLADGTLRITVDLSETGTKDFHTLFPAVHCAVAIAPLRPGQLATAQSSEDFGRQAEQLWKSGFFAQPEVWFATGTDEEFLAFVRTQKCIAKSGETHQGDVVAAHVWRGVDGFGKGIKGEYAAVPLCDKHHKAQHQYGEDAIGGRDYMEEKRYDTVRAWVWAEIKDHICVASMADADPIHVLTWAQKRGVDIFLPDAYRQAA